MYGVKLLSMGKAVPVRHMTNDELTQFVDTSDEWIKSRTGIEKRHISTGETTTDLAINAAKEALERSGIDPRQIGLIVVATITGDYIMPSTACQVQAAIGAENATAFDIAAACSGFLYGAKLATDAVRVGSCEYALVIGAEVLSKTVDWEDRSTCVLFGDGAGAAIFQKHHKNNIINIYTQSNGGLSECLTLPSIPLKNCCVEQETRSPYMFMDGRAVYKFATTVVPMSIQRVLEGTSYTLDDIKYFILHQANARIMDSVAKKLEVPTDKFFKNLHEYGNTSSASIPMALYDLQEELKPGDPIVLCGFGGGVTWGSMLLVWE
ncbi:MAG: beta-ketoacyl-ACP synthase III [Niameybacter sp.]|uniref:beta-ketoacyl-ACP synthase III n=1 Tax=Niameybacter sp. TaxID=2033640 RepID=UPI002FC80046